MIAKLNELRDYIHNMNREKGFWDKERNIGEALMLVVTELAEAMETHRKEGIEHFADDVKETVKNLSDDEFKEHFQFVVKDSVGDEIADAVIRILDLCGGTGIDIEWHIAMKLRYNATRERLHGKKY